MFNWLLSFPLWALLASLIAFQLPEFFASFKSSILPLLMVVMFGMGMTLKWQNFYQVWLIKRVVLLGLALQYFVMPLAAFLIAKALHFNMEMTLGMMLVGATAGGVSSNVMTYLAKGDVALSVSLTALSTLLSIVMLPFLIWLYLGESIQIPVTNMMQSLLQIVFLPIVLGMLIGHFLHNKIQPIVHWFPFVSKVAIILIIAIVVALNAQNLQQLILPLVLAVMLHNAIGLFSGYLIVKKMGYEEAVARTMAIEVGMQNSGLSVALALKYFTPAAALPGALFSIWHNVSGGILASYWQSKPVKKS